MTLLEYYQTKKEDASRKIAVLSRRMERLSALRLIAFLGTFIFYWMFRHSLVPAILLPFASFGSFLYLVRIHIQTSRDWQRNQVLAVICEREIQAARHEFGDFHDGNEFTDPSHPYSFDLDIFGKGSLFQMMNRTTTSGGTEMLAKWMKAPLLNPVEIIERQQSVNELAQLRDWRTKFLLEGSLLEVSDDEKAMLTGNFPDQYRIKDLKMLRAMMYILPLLSGVALGWLITGGTHLWLLLMLLINLGVLFAYRKIIDRYYTAFGNRTQTTEKYLSLLDSIEQQDFQGTELHRIRDIILKDGKATSAFRSLKKRMAQFEIRQNIIPGMILNSLLIWDLQSVIRLHDWQKAHASKLENWLKTVDHFDAFTSLATFADHNPKYTWPTPIKENIILDATGLGHPMLKPGKRIVNDIRMKGWSEIAIVTGANMAGKSTFLRSVGLNFVLAGVGCPVAAEDMRYYPLDIFTSMRTNDSLLMEESYFLAELKRLAKLMERLRSGEAMLVLLDEMLKGTNSTDKLKGSQYLVRELATTQSVTILATHDVQLTEMEKLYPDRITNYCFEIVHDGDDLIFDYKLRPGIVKTMNASLLMKKMGIIKNNI